MRGVQTIIAAAGPSTAIQDADGNWMPKSLVTIDGAPVLRRAVDAYAVDLSSTAVALNVEAEAQYSLSGALADLNPEPRVVLVPSGVQGALATTVLAAGDLDPSSPLVIASGDSEVRGPIGHHVEAFLASNLDASTLVFASTEPRWSYLAVTSDGYVSHVAEKRVVGPYATTGVFMFRSMESFLSAATWCFEVNARVNGQFYVSTTLNHLIFRGQRVGFDVIPRSRYFPWALPSDFATK